MSRSQGLPFFPRQTSIRPDRRLALTIFFVPYVLFEIPSNVILKKLRPHVWLSLCMFGFGLVTICQGLVQSYGGLLTTRFFLGVFESGMFPGSFYLIGMWYVSNFSIYAHIEIPVLKSIGTNDMKRKRDTLSSSPLPP